ncbi:MAG: formyltransferase family protein [Desulfuromonadaceae bacterium]|nr:formyltransferase family protein [Desulfuromonadaceae bacterium]
MKNPVKVVYAGYHIETALLLYRDKRFDVAGIGLIEEFVSCATYNPVNALFKIIYLLRCRNQYRLLEIALLRILTLVSSCATSFYFRYVDYLKVISESGTEILDFNNKIKIVDFLKSKRVDITVVNAWSILAEEIVTAPSYGTVNVHPSKLPQYRGALPTLWSLKNGDSESAVTCFVVDNAIDTGSIVSQHPFPIGEDADWYSVEMSINRLLQETFTTDVMKYVRGEIKPTPQDMCIKSHTGKYFEYMEIDWVGEHGRDIYNKINLYPFLVPEDYCYTFINNRKIALRKATFVRSHAGVNGTGTYYVDGCTVYVQAQSGVIACPLFSGVRFSDSLYLLLNRNGTFG